MLLLNKEVLALVIGMDHGNTAIKVVTDNLKTKYASGFCVADVEPISSENLLIYEGKYYSIVERFAVQTNKTLNEDFFILSLIGIAKAISAAEIKKEEVDVILASGLPIMYFGKLKKEFKEHFIRDNIKFSYNGVNYKINIKENFVFPQAYSSFLINYSKYKDYGNMVAVDIGGYTVDIVKVENGVLDVSSCTSLPYGSIKLYNQIRQEMLRESINITESQIQDVILNNKPLFLDDVVVSMIKNKSAKYVNNLLTELQEYNFELKINPVLFLGGASLLLKEYIENNSKVTYSEFQIDEYGNAEGFKMLAEQSLARR